MSEESRLRLAVMVPLLLALLAHVAGIGGGFTNWDDPLYLLGNPLTVDPLGHGLEHLLLTPEIDYSIPVTVLGYAMQRALFGLNPFYFHLVSLLMHLGVVLLSYAICRRLGVARFAAAAGASLFAVHPVTVEPVAWVVGQKDLWAALFLLGAVYVRLGGAGLGRGIAVIGLSVLALGAKPSAVVAPALIIAVDVFMRRDPKQPAQVLVYLCLVGAAVAATVLAVMGHADLEEPASLGLATVANAGWAATLQIHHLIAPGGLSAAYYSPSGLSYGIQAGIGLLLGAGIIAGVVALARRRARVAALSLALAVLAYAPVSGLVQIGRGPADSYLYLPLALLAAAIGLGAAALLERGRRPMRFALAAVFAIFILVSAARTQVWAGPEALWSDVVLAYPDHPMAHRRYANALQYNGKLDEAIEVLEASHARWPEHAITTLEYALTLDHLGRDGDAERMFALAAKDGNTQFFRRYYANYVATHPRLEVSAPVIAERAIVEEVPRWIAQPTPAPVLLRAADLLELGGAHSAEVEALRAAATD